MSTSPLVSVIVPTKDSAEFLEACLISIRAQTYTHLELIVVDNFSRDATAEIASRYADLILFKGPERSAQVNYGVARSNGEFVYKVDSDFVLDPKVVEECVNEIAKGYDAIVVHNTPDPDVSWIARIRKFEVDMYKYDLTHSSARFLKRSVFAAIGGFNEAITAGEDYDFQNRLNRAGFKTGFIRAEAVHLGEPRSLIRHLRKMFAYGRDLINFTSENQEESLRQLGFFRSAFRTHWLKFVQHPVKTAVLFLYLAGKFCAGGLGYLVGKVQRQ